MILDLFRLDGRVALVTGAARGIGAAIAGGLAEAGADVALLDVGDCNETSDAITAADRRSSVLKVDLGELTELGADGAVNEVVGALGGIDILVNNAGIIRRADAVDYSEADWNAVLQVNLTSAFLLAQATARYLMRHGSGGKIIQIASMLSFQGGVRVPAYAAAKSGIAGLTRALANEWAPHGINVNAIAPGYFTTKVTAALRADAEREHAVLSRIPAGRWGDPADVVGAAVFLASDASAYVHGVVLPVDGGWLCW